MYRLSSGAGWLLWSWLAVAPGACFAVFFHRPHFDSGRYSIAAERLQSRRSSAVHSAEQTSRRLRHRRLLSLPRSSTAARTAPPPSCWIITRRCAPTARRAPAPPGASWPRASCCKVRAVACYYHSADDCGLVLLSTSARRAHQRTSAASWLRASCCKAGNAVRLLLTVLVLYASCSSNVDVIRCRRAI